MPFPNLNHWGDIMNEHFVFFEAHKVEIVDNWVIRLVMAYPHHFDSTQLKIMGDRYLSLILDVHIPIEQHPVFQEFKYWCEMLCNKNAPLDQILQSSAFFRESLLESLSQFDAEFATLLHVISIVSSRIDAFQTAVYKYFWSHAHGMIEQKDKTIEDMHEDKLNLIGKMASSMAHEIRNPLTSIKGFFTLIRKTLPGSALGMIEKYMEIIEHEFHNIEMQITGFLSFSRKPIVEENPVAAPLNELIEKTLLLVNPLLINENIELSLMLPEGLIVNVQKVAMLQVFSNLLNNAIDALQEVKGERKITIHSFADDYHIYLQFSNTGPEIPSEIQQSLFNPFVTSKSDGTGLGLAICKQIVERNGAIISFVTNKRETSFTVRFNKYY